MSLNLVVLGANSAYPLLDRFSSSFVLRHGNKSFLIDAGEGCQVKLSQFKIKKIKISHIFISHLHGDHVFGLPGLITSYGLNQRTSPLTIFGPTGIKRYLETILEISQCRVGFELIINELDKDEFQSVLTLDDLEVHAFPLQHRIKTFGYLFKEIHPFKNIITEKIAEYKMSREEILEVKKGKDLKRGDKWIPNNTLTFEKGTPKSFAYCSDTIYDETLIDYLQGVDLLYHEATYTEDFRVQAKERMHCTAHGAATIASKSKAKALLIGHFSSRYMDLSPLLKEAKSVFENSHLALEGTILNI